MKRIPVFDPFTQACVAARVGALAAMCLLAPVPAGAVGDGADARTDPRTDPRNDPHGVWLRPEGGEKFSFYDCDGGLLCAKLVSVAKAEDAKAVGTVILRGAAKSGPNEWKGKLYNAEDGKTYEGYVSLRSANELRLKGCLWGVLCSGETWTRVAAAAAPAKARGRDAAGTP